MDVTITKVGGGSVTVQSEDFFYALRHESVNGVDDVILIAGVPYVLSSATFGAGGGMSYGGAVTTGHNNEVLYIGATGLLASDSLFTRTAAGINIEGSNAQITISNDILGLGLEGAMLLHEGDGQSYVIVSDGLGVMEYKEGDVSHKLGVNPGNSYMAANVDGTDYDCILSITDPDGVKIQGKNSLSSDNALTIYRGADTPFTGYVILEIANNGDFSLIGNDSVNAQSVASINTYSGTLQAGIGQIVIATGINHASANYYHKITLENNNDGIEIEAKDTNTCDTGSIRVEPTEVTVFVGGNSINIFQGAAVADATGAGDIVSQFNTLLARLRESGGCGLIAD